MADEIQTNGAAQEAEQPKPQTIREIAEAAYDQLDVDLGEGAEQQPAEPTGQPAQPRDNLGRFVPKDAKPGEADGAQEPTQPREEAQKPQEPTQPAQAASSEAPANWSAADRETFAKQTPEAKAFLLRRHSEMESDYQRRVQANTRAAEFTSALDPIFRDPVIAGSLQANRMAPLQAIQEWAGFHRRAMSPNVGDRVGLLFDLAARMQIDPAVFTTGQPGPTGLSPKDLEDPAIKFFADHIGRTSTEVMALRSELQRMQHAAAEQQNAEALKVTRWGIDNFADEKGPDGKLLRPDFDQVLDQVIELFRVNPNRDLKEAYETARWMNANTRQSLITAERSRVEQQHSNQRAAQAVRSNVRGLTSPVSRPQDNSGKPKSLRDTIEESADQIGF